MVEVIFPFHKELLLKERIDSSFEYPQHMFLLKNKKFCFSLHTLNYSPSGSKFFPLREVPILKRTQLKKFTA